MAVRKVGEIELGDSQFQIPVYVDDSLQMNQWGLKNQCYHCMSIGGYEFQCEHPQGHEGDHHATFDIGGSSGTITWKPFTNNQKEQVSFPNEASDETRGDMSTEAVTIENMSANQLMNLYDKKLIALREDDSIDLEEAIDEFNRIIELLAGFGWCRDIGEWRNC